MRYTYDNDLLPERAFTRLGKHLTTLEGKSSPAPPDYKPMAAANEKAAKYGYDAATNDLTFRKQQYADAQPRLEQLYDMADKVGQSQNRAYQARPPKRAYKTLSWLTFFGLRRCAIMLCLPPLDPKPCSKESRSKKT